MGNIGTPKVRSEHDILFSQWWGRYAIGLTDEELAAGCASRAALRAAETAWKASTAMLASWPTRVDSPIRRPRGARGRAYGVRPGPAALAPRPGPRGSWSRRCRRGSSRASRWAVADRKPRVVPTPNRCHHTGHGRSASGGLWAAGPTPSPSAPIAGSRTAKISGCEPGWSPRPRSRGRRQRRSRPASPSPRGRRRGGASPG
jgi:hypothetical protein